MADFGGHALITLGPNIHGPNNKKARKTGGLEMPENLPYSAATFRGGFERAGIVDLAK